ncbi:TPA: restriction endonuclease subunit S [Photobacterium damselae]
MSELPKGWVVSKIDLLCSKPEQLKPEASRKFNYIDISSVNRETKTICEPSEIFGKDAPSRARKIVNTGDVLVSMTRPNLNAVAKVPDKYNGQIASTGFDVLKPILIEPNWLFSVVKSKSFIDSISGTTIGALYPACKASDIRGYEMPVPPLNEQKRIVEKLDEVLAQVDTIKARLDGIPAILKRFRQSVLAAAVSGKLTEEWRVGCSVLGQDLGLIERTKIGLINNKTVKKDLDFEISNKIFDIPDTWSFLKLKSLSSKITDGEHKTPKREESGRYLLSARNVRDGYLCLDNVDYVGEEEYQKLRKRCDPNQGDILISCSGSVGRISLVDTDDKYVMVRSAALVKVMDEFLVNSYLVYVLQSPELQKRIEESSKSTAQSNLFLGPIKELEIPLPSISEQKEIVRLVDQYFAFADTIEAQVKKAQTRVNNLTQSILAKAFRGELVEQDPNDEPADKLLERIAAARKEAEALAKAAKKAQTAKKRTVKKESAQES